MRRPRIPDELAAEVDAWRGNVPFEPAVADLLRIGLAHQREVVKAVATAIEAQRQVPGPGVPLSETWRR